VSTVFRTRSKGVVTVLLCELSQAKSNNLSARSGVSHEGEKVPHVNLPHSSYHFAMLTNRKLHGLKVTSV